MKKSKFYTSSTLQQVCISFQVGSEMEKDAPIHDKSDFYEPSPRDTIMVTLQGFLSLKKEEMKNALSLILRNLPILFYNHLICQGVSLSGSSETMDFC